jgi:hypothetical protein
MAGIYKIEHKSGFFYIGMSVDIFGRWSSHYSDIKLKKHSSTEFGELWNKTEPCEWFFSVLEYVSITEWKKASGMKGKAAVDGFRKHLLKLEKDWMKKFSINWALNKNKRYFS